MGSFFVKDPPPRVCGRSLHGQNYVVRHPSNADGYRVKMDPQELSMTQDFRRRYTALVVQLFPPRYHPDVYPDGLKNSLWQLYGEAYVFLTVGWPSDDAVATCWGLMDEIAGTLETFFRDAGKL